MNARQLSPDLTVKKIPVLSKDTSKNLRTMDHHEQSRRNLETLEQLQLIPSGSPRRNSEGSQNAGSKMSAHYSFAAGSRGHINETLQKYKYQKEVLGQHVPFRIAENERHQAMTAFQSQSKLALQQQLNRKPSQDEIMEKSNSQADLMIKNAMNELQVTPHQNISVHNLNPQSALSVQLSTIQRQQAPQLKTSGSQQQLQYFRNLQGQELAIFKKLAGIYMQKSSGDDTGRGLVAVGGTDTKTPHVIDGKKIRLESRLDEIMKKIGQKKGQHVELQKRLSEYLTIQTLQKESSGRDFALPHPQNHHTKSSASELQLLNMYSRPDPHSASQMFISQTNQASPGIDSTIPNQMTGVEPTGVDLATGLHSDNSPTAMQTDRHFPSQQKLASDGGNESNPTNNNDQDETLHGPDRTDDRSVAPTVAANAATPYDTSQINIMERLQIISEDNPEQSLQKNLIQNFANKTKQGDPVKRPIMMPNHAKLMLTAQGDDTLQTVLHRDPTVGLEWSQGQHTSKVDPVKWQQTQPMSFQIGRSTEGYFNKNIETVSKDETELSKEASQSPGANLPPQIGDKSSPILKKEFGFTQGNQDTQQYIDTALLDEQTNTNDDSHTPNKLGKDKTQDSFSGSGTKTKSLHARQEELEQRDLKHMDSKIIVDMLHKLPEPLRLALMPDIQTSLLERRAELQEQIAAIKLLNSSKSRKIDVQTIAALNFREIDLYQSETSEDKARKEKAPAEAETKKVKTSPKRVTANLPSVHRNTGDLRRLQSMMTEQSKVKRVHMLGIEKQNLIKIMKLEQMRRPDISIQPRIDRLNTLDDQIKQLRKEIYADANAEQAPDREELFSQFSNLSGGYRQSVEGAEDYQNYKIETARPPSEQKDDMYTTGQELKLPSDYIEKQQTIKNVREVNAEYVKKSFKDKKNISFQSGLKSSVAIERMTAEGADSVPESSILESNQAPVQLMSRSRDATQLQQSLSPIMDTGQNFQTSGFEFLQSANDFNPGPQPLRAVHVRSNVVTAMDNVDEAPGPAGALGQTLNVVNATFNEKSKTQNSFDDPEQRQQKQIKPRLKQQKQELIWSTSAKIGVKEKEKLQLNKVGTRLKLPRLNSNFKSPSVRADGLSPLRAPAAAFARSRRNQSKLTVEDRSDGLAKYERLRALDSGLTRHAHGKLPPVLSGRGGSVLDQYGQDHATMPSINGQNSVNPSPSRKYNISVIGVSKRFRKNISDKDTEPYGSIHVSRTDFRGDTRMFAGQDTVHMVQATTTYQIPGQDKSPLNSWRSGEQNADLAQNLFRTTKSFIKNPPGMGATASFEGEPINPRRPFDKEQSAILIQETELGSPRKHTEEPNATKSETAGEDRLPTKGLIEQTLGKLDSKEYLARNMRTTSAQRKESGSSASARKPNEDLNQILNVPKYAGMKQRGNMTRVLHKPTSVVRETVESRSTSQHVPYTESTTKAPLGKTALQLSMFGASTGKMDVTGGVTTPGINGAGQTGGTMQLALPAHMQPRLNTDVSSPHIKVDGGEVKDNGLESFDESADRAQSADIEALYQADDSIQIPSTLQGSSHVDLIGSNLQPFDKEGAREKWQRNLTIQERMVHQGLEQSLAKQRVQSKSRFGVQPQIHPAVASVILERVDDSEQGNQNISRLTRSNLNQVKSQASKFKAGHAAQVSPSKQLLQQMSDGAQTITVSISEVRQLSNAIKQMSTRGKVARRIEEVLIDDQQ